MPVDLRPRDGRHQPVCRYHGARCDMGRRWPVDPPEETAQDKAIRELIAAARGETVPEPDLSSWYINRHKAYSKAEIRARSAHMAELLQQARQANADKLARLKARWEETRRAR